MTHSHILKATSKALLQFKVGLLTQVYSTPKCTFGGGMDCCMVGGGYRVIECSDDRGWEEDTVVMEVGWRMLW